MKFQPFNLEIGKIVGNFDGEVMNINPNEEYGEAVFYHELVHGFISSTTPDGYVLNILALLKEKNLTESKIEKLFWKFLSGSKVAHESAATYLGIDDLPIKQGKKIKKKLDDEYQEYYENFNHIGKYLRPVECRIVIQAIVIYIFSSPALMHLKIGQEAYDLLNDDDLLPDIRFSNLKDWLSKERINEMLSFCLDSLPSSDKEIYDQYIAAKSKSALSLFLLKTSVYIGNINIIADKVLNFAVKWLEKNGPLEFIKKDEFDWGEIVDEYVQKGMLSGTMKPQLMKKELMEEGQKTHDQRGLEAELYTSITNPNPHLLNIGLVENEIKLANEMMSYRDQKFYFIFSNVDAENTAHVVCHSKKPNKIKINQLREGEKIFKFRFPMGFGILRQIVVNANMAVQMPGYKVRNKTPRPSMVIVRSKNMQDHMSDPIADIYADRPISRSYMCPYSCSSRWTRFFSGINFIPEFPIVWYLDTEIEVMIFHGTPSLLYGEVITVDENFCAFVIWKEKHTGIFLKILPKQSSKPLKRMFENNHWSDKIRPLANLQNHKFIRKSALSAIRNILHLWEKF